MDPMPEIMDLIHWDCLKNWISMLCKNRKFDMLGTFSFSLSLWQLTLPTSFSIDLNSALAYMNIIYWHFNSYYPLSSSLHSLAMLAVVGWPMSELLAPDWMLQDGGCAPSVLNGVNPLSFLAIAAFLGASSFFEYKTALRPSLDTPMGKLHAKDMSAIWKYGVAGDYNWDPLHWYSSCGDDFKGRKGLRDVELSHGRVAMLGITYFAAWEALTNHAIVENNMLFHPNALFPLLVAGYVGWSQIYEVSPLNEYPIEIKYTNEGEMKYKRLTRGIEDIAEQISASSKKTKETLDVLDSKFDIYSKLDAGKQKVEEAIRSAVTLETVEAEN
jgi:hypothetical protein